MNKNLLVLGLLLSATALVQSTAQVQPDIFQTVATRNHKAFNNCLKTSPSAILSRNALGQSVLHVAVAQKNLNWIIKLVRSGAQVNAVDAQGKTALDLAVEMKSHKIIYQLVKFGAKVNKEINAVRLKCIYKARAVKFFVAGWFFSPFLWIGSIFAMNNASDVMVLTV